MAKKEKKPKPPKVKKEKVKKEGESGKNNKMKIIILGAVGVVLFGAIVFSAFMLIDSRKTPDAETAEVSEAAETGEAGAAGEAGEAGETGDEEESSPGLFDRIKGMIFRNSGDGEAKEPKKEKYSVKFDPGDLKTIYTASEKEGEPHYEVLVNSARQLNAEEKVNYGLTKESGRLAKLELDVRLIDPSLEWGLYNRRIADSKGNWLDEIKFLADNELLDVGLVDSQALFVRLPGDEAEKDEKITLSIYTSTWNEKKRKPDGTCEIAIAPPLPPTPQPRPGSGGRGGSAALTEMDTDYGRWDGRTYTSSELDMRITLPDDWNARLSNHRESSEHRSIEGAAIRSDGSATMQLLVNKKVGSTDESDQIDFFKDLLERAVGDFAVSEPFSQTIAGREYHGITYSRDDSTYQVFFMRNGNDLVEVALHFPMTEKDQANQFLSNNMKTMN